MPVTDTDALVALARLACARARHQPGVPLLIRLFDSGEVYNVPGMQAACAGNEMAVLMGLLDGHARGASVHVQVRVDDPIRFIASMRMDESPGEPGSFGTSIGEIVYEGTSLSGAMRAAEERYDRLRDAGWSNDGPLRASLGGTPDPGTPNFSPARVEASLPGLLEQARAVYGL